MEDSTEPGLYMRILEKVTLDCSKPTRKPGPPAGFLSHGASFGSRLFKDPGYRGIYLSFEDLAQGCDLS
jgi:hypothetical protein